MAQLRDGYGHSVDVNRPQELAHAKELYPDLDPRVQRMAATELMQIIQVVSENRSCTDEDRLHYLHRLLEFSTLEQEFEVQCYQAAHRRLLEYEEEFRQMLQTR